jgi:hypothetical protein
VIKTGIKTYGTVHDTVVVSSLAHVLTAGWQGARASESGLSAAGNNKGFLRNYKGQ